MIGKSKIKYQISVLRHDLGLIQNFGFCFFVLLLAFCILNYRCYAQIGGPAEELIKNSKEYDGKIVTYAGELIGESLRRKGGMWLNLHDGINGALGVWVPENVPVDILYSGGYKTIGDRLCVIGEFHRICLEHGGDLDIHAHKISRIEPGRIKPQALVLYKKNLVLYLSGILLCLLMISLILKKRQSSR